MCFAPQRRALFRHLNFQKWSEPGVFRTFWLGNVLRATTACQLPKAVRTRRVLYILTRICASRHNGAHFFDISTSKSGPDLACFVHFDSDMCFAPQRRVLFRHLNFQKWSETMGFWHFWLGNVLRATTARTFSTAQPPKVVRCWCVYTFWLLACNFSSLLWPAGSAPAALARLPSHSFSYLIFSIFDLLLPDSYCTTSAFPFLHIVGSLTSKLPLMTNHLIQESDFQ